VKNVERSREFIESDKINKINCDVGYMALAGSTRMQSTTILMYAIGVSLLGCNRIRNIRYPELCWKEYAILNINTFLNYIIKTDFSVIAKLIEYETDIYRN
jgi:N-acetylmuramic acid 6-phosphate etherase